MGGLMRRLGLACVVGLLWLAAPTSAEAACGGSSPNLTATTWADLIDCVDNVAVSSVDRIDIAAGTLNATSQLTISKCLVIAGAGGITEQTILTDDVTTAVPMLTYNVPDNCTTARLTGFKVVDGLRTSQLFAPNGILRLVGQADERRIRVDDVWLYQVMGNAVLVQTVFGVFEGRIDSTPTRTPFTFYGTTWGGEGNGDGSWAAASNWGSDEFFFVENSTLTYPVGVGAACLFYAFNDGYAGARYVFRYNTLTGGYIGGHGTESTGRTRGEKQKQIYRNIFQGCNSTNILTNARSGSVYAFDNALAGHTITPSIVLNNERVASSFFPWGQADGRNEWDENNAGTPFGASPFTVASSTGTVGAAGGTVDVTSAGWTPNFWRGYTIRKLTAPCNIAITSSDATTNRILAPGHGLTTGDAATIVNHVGATPRIGGRYTPVTVIDADYFTFGVDVTVGGTGGYVSDTTVGNSTCSAQIQSNDADTLTYATDGGYSQTVNLTFTAGDTFEITLIDDVFDGPGKGAGSLITGGTVTAPPLPAAWHDQADDPILEWNNDFCPSVPAVLNCASSVDIDASPGSGLAYELQIRSIEHYVNDIPFGTSLPASVVVTNTAEDYYFKTDAGSWNTSCGDGSDGILYKRNGVEWAEHYTPSQCPHALATAGGNQAPTVSAGADQGPIEQDGYATLVADASDDGLPADPGELSYQWTIVEDDCTSTTFGTDTAATTNLSLIDVAGCTATVQIEVDDGEFTDTDTVIVTLAAAPAGMNIAPTVTLAPTVTARLGTCLALSTVIEALTDDGLDAAFTVLWETTVQPGNAPASAPAFTSATNPNTDVCFYGIGTYTLRLTADDTGETANDTISVKVLGPASRRQRRFGR